jgi:hypothetical protein
MKDPWQSMISRQLAASIQMIRQAIDSCPEALWCDAADGTPFWHVAYHALFFIDLYLSENEKAFKAMEFHVPKAQFLPGDYREYGGIVATPEQPIPKDKLRAYADHCLAKCAETVEKVTDERALERCGFWWYELNVGEFLLNNLRHAQHHAGQLALLLRRRAGIGIDWMGTKDNQPPAPTW